jgi:hypothetical protein
MSAYAKVLGVLSYVSAAVLAAAIVASLLRRWRLALGLARAVALGGVALLALSAAVMAVPPNRTDVDPTLKATMLAKGVSEVINCGILSWTAVVPGAVLWLVARSRLAATEAR